jgi:hypothetical protein
VTTAGRALIGDESEAHFQQRVVQLARRLGWQRQYHTRDSMGSAPGFPDLLLVRPPRKVWAELKSAHGRLTNDQKLWLDDLRACGDEAYAWRPADWSEILRVLGAA